MKIPRAVLWAILAGFVILTAVAVYLVNSRVHLDSSRPGVELRDDRVRMSF